MDKTRFLKRDPYGYADVLRQLYTINVFSGIKLGLENAERLQAALNFPDRHYPVIHIAGTNGKGTLAFQLGEALRLAGYRVGVFTSPHISSFRERIQVNGELISEQEVLEGLQTLFNVTEKEKIPATFFEYCALLAFSHFAQKEVDVAVVEVGLGGRLDATNVVKPLLSIITSIGFDHMQVLGNSLEAIAREKAGVVKPGVPVLIGPTVPHELVQSLVKGAELRQSEQLLPEALQMLEKDFPRLTTLDQTQRQQLQEARPPCRLEWIAPRVLLDVAHNPAALERLFTRVPQPCRAVVALSAGKDVEGCLALLRRNTQFIHFVEAPNGRSVPALDLAARLPDCSKAYASIEDALDEALQGEETVVCCGSFFIMATIRKHFGVEEACDPWDLNEQPLSPAKAGP